MCCEPPWSILTCTAGTKRSVLQWPGVALFPAGAQVVQYKIYSRGLRLDSGGLPSSVFTVLLLLFIKFSLRHLADSIYFLSLSSQLPHSSLFTSLATFSLFPLLPSLY